MSNRPRKRRPWLLLINGPNIVKEFTSQAKLRAFSKAKLLEIYRSPMDDRSFYSINYQYIPGGR